MRLLLFMILLPMILHGQILGTDRYDREVSDYTFERNEEGDIEFVRKHRLPDLDPCIVLERAKMYAYNQPIGYCYETEVFEINEQEMHITFFYKSETKGAGIPLVFNHAMRIQCIDEGYLMTVREISVNGEELSKTQYYPPIESDDDSTNKIAFRQDFFLRLDTTMRNVMKTMQEKSASERLAD